MSRALGLLRRRSFATAAKSQTKITTLPSGLRVATTPAQSHFCAVGVYVNAGPAFEPEADAGGSHFVSSLAFKSTTTSSASETMHSMAQLGGNLFCTPARESIVYQGSVLRHEVPLALKLLSDVTLSPGLTDEELDLARESIIMENEEFFNRPDAITGEALHAIAFQRKGLGNSLLCDPDQARRLDNNAVRNYFARYLHPSRMVVAGSGIPHQELVELATEHFAPRQKLRPVPLSDVPKSLYVGGSAQLVIPKPPPTHLNPEPPLTHVQIAFPVPSFTDPDMFPLSMLQVLMGGGGAFSAGGPGKGMYSRLYTNVLNRYRWMESCHAFLHSYAMGPSLFGLSASCTPTFNRHVVNVLVGEMVHMASNLSDEEFSRAKNQLKSSLLMSLESQVVSVEDLGRQVLAQGFRMEPAELLSRIEAITKDDIARVARSVVTQKPTMVAVGEELDGLAHIEDTLRAFRGARV
ncbi:mitochondrial processing peptidase alpha subunit [Blastocladiella britannica]|nr:mitochondrial processing peptidase alpha subunit [Blastocladiella britannica]